MGQNGLETELYAGEWIILTTKHAKALAVGKPFEKYLKANFLEYVVDTDQLGTFSGEIERKQTALECAKKKCELALEIPGSKIEFALASEGSFGPHPLIPFAASDHEILYFIDQRRNFHLHISYLSTETNYQMERVDTLEKLLEFAKATLFPSHALILRANRNEMKGPIYKGLQSEIELKDAFTKIQKSTPDRFVWVETDMRAHLNPTRMKVIEEAGAKLARRLATLCPSCGLPGWGLIELIKGLECTLCGMQTELIRSEIFGCVKCTYREVKNREDGLKSADPANCQYCNP